MSSSEEYLDSLLDSILGGGKPEEEEKAVSVPGDGESQTASSDSGKAMSPEEIEEMLVSMGTLGGTEKETQKQADSEAEDMEAMLAFMNEHNAGVTDQGVAEEKLPGTDEPNTGSPEYIEDGADGLDLEESSAEDTSFDNLSLDDLDLGESSAEDTSFDNLSLDGLPLDDVGTDDGAGLADIALEDIGSGEETADGLDDLSLDDLDLGESSADDVNFDNLSLDDLDLGESSVEDASLDNLSLDDLSLDDGAGSGDVALEDIGSGEETVDGLDDLSLDDLDLGESGADDVNFDNLSLDDLDLGESSVEDASLDNLSLDDLSLDDAGTDDGADSTDFALEDTGSDEETADGLMSEEDIDRLLNGDLPDEETGTEDFALEETGESDEDLSALLAGMDHDEDLSEINDLLEESDQGVSPDDEMLAMLEGADDNGDSSFDFFENDEAAREAESIRELTPEEIAARENGEKPKKEKKKRRKLFGKKKKDNEEEKEITVEETGDELEALLGEMSEQEPLAEAGEEEKKPGFFARIMNFLLETDEEDEDPVASEILADNGGETGTVSDENKEILAELKEEDKKGKKKKKKDRKKGKKGKEGEGEGEGEEAAEGEEEDSKKARKKKKKEKKKKEEEEVDLFAPPEKKLSKKKVITVFVFCGTVAACIVLMSSFLPNYLEKREAQVAYDHQDYAEVYDLLYGKKLNEQDEMLFKRSNLILQMNRKLSSYENYVNLDMRLEALNALIGGVARYQEVLPEAESCNVVGEVSDIYAQILERLSADFGVSESDALEIIASEDDVTYSQRLEAIISGAVYGEDVPAGRQDVLPEEEEIIERIDGLENGSDEGQPEDMPTDENADEGAE